METALGNPPLSEFINILDSGDGVVVQFRVGGFFQLPFTYDRYREFKDLVVKRYNEIEPLILRQAQEIMETSLMEKNDL